jgi:hypothetical protein
MPKSLICSWEAGRLAIAERCLKLAQKAPATASTSTAASAGAFKPRNRCRNVPSRSDVCGASGWSEMAYV